MPKINDCETCQKSYKSARGLRGHYATNPEHRITELRLGNSVMSAMETVKKFLNVSSKYKNSRLKELINTLSSEDIHEFVLPHMSKRIKLYELLLAQCGSLSVKDKLSELFQQLDKNHEPELKYILNCHGYTKAKHITDTPSHEGNSNFPSNLAVITYRPIVPSRNLSGQQFRAPFDSQLLRVLNNNLCQSENVQKKFCKLSAELVTSLDISRKDYQLLVRNSIGQQIQNVLHVNPFVPKWLMEKELKQKSEHFKANFKLYFSEWNDTVGGHIDLEKAIQWILGKESLKDVIKVDNGVIIVFFYVDLFPWMSWNRYFQGETSIRIKILEPTNTYDSIATVTSWLGPDKAEYVCNLGKKFFDQMNSVKVVTHPLSKKQVKVEFRGLADGAQRRSVMGSSSASSLYPIPECPEHKSQLGDLSVYQKEPVLTAVDATEANKKFEEYIAGKKLTKSSRSEFAKHNLGMTGMINPTGLDINMVYPPMMHRTLNSLASICLRINTISKSSNTDSCYVRVSGDLHDHVADAELLRKALEGYSVTNTILARGLSDKYDVNIISNVSVRDLRDYFPVVCDPALVQAGLLAAKSITEEYLGCGSGLKVQDFVGRIAALQSTFEMQF